MVLCILSFNNIIIIFIFDRLCSMKPDCDEASDYPNPHVLVGAVVDGPGIVDDFPDKRMAPSNRVSITINAPFQSSVAGKCNSGHRL